MSEPIIDPFLLNLSIINDEHGHQREHPVNFQVAQQPRITTPALQVDYNKLQNSVLKDLCKERRLKVGGKKAELIERLLLNDRVTESGVSAVASHSTVEGVIEAAQISDKHSTDIPSMDIPTVLSSEKPINTVEVLNECESLAGYFERGLVQDKQDINESDSDEEAEVADKLDPDDDILVIDNSKTHEAIAWADNFILETRRKGGRQTETSAWVTIALDKGLISDMIIDSVHMIEYLKHAATRNLFTTRGGKKTSTSRLSASSLKKIMTMLGRVRRRQEDTDPTLKIERPAKNSRTDDFFRALMVQAQRYRLESADFDITQGTILDSQLSPEQFDEITKSIFLKLPQLPSIIKAHFSWTWQCATLNRSDEVVSITLASIHPYNLPLPSYMYQNGQISATSATSRKVFGVLAMFHETKTAQPGKTEPTYSFVLPHRDPLMCSVGALAILLHFMFDQQDIMSRVPDWDWLDISTWQKHHILFGKTVNEAMLGDGHGRMYSSFLDSTSITSGKKTHLARRTIPSKLEEMGVPADQVDATGHWQGNTRREAAVALAGFPVGESYCVPWTQVPVPEGLEKMLYPFCEDALAKLRASGCKNQGMMNFLLLLQKLRPFFWQVIGAINARFPKSAMISRLKVTHNSDAQDFLRKWGGLRAQEENTRHQSLIIEHTFQEKPTQDAFAAVISEIQSLRQTVDASVSQISVIHRRSEVLSPSKILRPHKSAHVHSRHSVSTQITPIPLPITPPQYSTQPTASRFSFGSPTLSPQHHPPLVIVSPGRRGTNLSITRVGIHHILHLTPPASPTLPPVQTQHDLILPPCSAFSGSLYPQFTTHNCTWQHIFDAVTNPVELWTTYEPGSLGEYPDIRSLWQAWDEGTFIVDVGHKPALRLIDSRWGDLKNQKTKKKRFPAWRPRNNDNARAKWSRFYFFVQLIQDRVDSGYSSDAAVTHFDSLRKDDSVHGLFKRLKPKKQTQEKPIGDTTDTTVIDTPFTTTPSLPNPQMPSDIEASRKRKRVT